MYNVQCTMYNVLMLKSSASKYFRLMNTMCLLMITINIIVNSFTKIETVLLTHTVHQLTSRQTYDVSNHVNDRRIIS